MAKISRIGKRGSRPNRPTGLKNFQQTTVAAATTAAIITLTLVEQLPGLFAMQSILVIVERRAVSVMVIIMVTTIVNGRALKMLYRA